MNVRTFLWACAAKVCTVGPNCEPSRRSVGIGAAVLTFCLVSVGAVIFRPTNSQLPPDQGPLPPPRIATLKQTLPVITPARHVSRDVASTQRVPDAKDIKLSAQDLKLPN